MSPARIAAVTLLLLCTSAAVASDQASASTSRPQTGSSASVGPGSLLLERSPGQSPDISSRPESQPRSFSLTRRFRQRLPIDDGQAVCYTIQSYLVTRESRDSDVTMPVGYRVCTPSTKFQVKSADMPR